ncbi:hypothetical protein Syun_029897 [Stephania yunnanensis]|uniref:Uncharacterized protein n=1 Tax=Stephania yunnanensis TaxID=152371 RepID=A0AAP0EE20_9MAGN
MKELMMRILASIDEEASLAVILDDEPLVACYDIFRDLCERDEEEAPKEKK